MLMHHPATGFAIGDPSAVPLSTKPSPAEAEAFLGSMVLSASGWRGVFGASDDDLGEAIGPAKAYVAARMAAVFADGLLAISAEGGGAIDAGSEAGVAGRGRDPKARRAPVVALGVDTRPTGPAIADVMARVFVAKGLKVRYAFVCAAPEIMAWAKRSGALPADSPDRLDAFCYVSASHNPPGHNGVKFGLADGGVLAADIAKRLTVILRDGACAAPDIDAMAALCAAAPAKAVAALYAGAGLEKRKAISDYALFAREVAGRSSELAAQERELDALAAAAAERGAGIVVDMNGSARILSIDADFLGALGVRLERLNDAPRRFAHRIVPEGESLEPCRLALEKAHEKDPGFILGYVPDCDGDRGNLVYWDDDAGEAKALEAQDTFALAVLAELAVAAAAPPDAGLSGEARRAIACNDATSLRVDAIAKVFGAEVRRAETGEANVVGLARSLRGQGYEVRVLGEGSNGGVITHPAGVRDPLNTLSALLKLLCLRGKEGPFGTWLKLSGKADEYHDEFGLCDVLATMPRFTTTSVFEDRAALRIRSRDQAALKDAYGKLFAKAWPEIAASLEPAFGALTWRAWASAGSGRRPLEGPFGGSGSGGLSIEMVDESGNPAGFLWMRGSGTEPVFRAMADVRGGDAALERVLLERHASMVREADALAQGR